jgi:hypothetical protein
MQMVSGLVTYIIILIQFDQTPLPGDNQSASVLTTVANVIANVTDNAFISSTFHNISL